MPKRILVWTEADVVGGSDRALVELLRGLAGRPYAIRVAGIVNPEWDAWLREQVPWALPKVDVPVASLGRSPLTRVRTALAAGSDEAPRELSADDAATPLPVRAAVAALRYRQAAFNLVRLRRLMRAARPDVLFVNNGGYPGGESCRVACIAAQLERVPRVVHFVHNMAFPPNWPPAVERAYDRRVDRAVDAWITAAERASEALREVRRMTGVHTVHYGIRSAAPATPADPAQLGYDSGALNVAVVAALERRKGHRVLFEALDRLRARGVRVRCALLGDGPEDQRLRRVAPPEVRFLGRRDDVAAVLEASDLLVLPSTSNECLPLAILEAMQHGLAVIGTDVAGIPEEIEDGVTGRVVAPGDAGALAGALAELAGDPERRRRMGAAGRRRVEALFTPERMVEGVTALW